MFMRETVYGPVQDDFRRLRRLCLAPGLRRPPGCGKFNEAAPEILRVLSRAPLKVLMACPPTSGITGTGEALETDGGEFEVVVPTRGEFTLYLARDTTRLPAGPVAPPALVPDPLILSTQGGLEVARGHVAPDLTVRLDPLWIPPVATIGGSRRVSEAVASLHARMASLDSRLLNAARTDAARTLLHRWTAFYAPWLALGESTAFDDYVSHTHRLLAQLRSDTITLLGHAGPEKAPCDIATVAGTFRYFEAAIEGLAESWEDHLKAPMTSAIELLEEPSQTRAGNQTEIILRARERPIRHDRVRLTARASTPFGAEVSAVRGDLTASHATLSPRAHLGAYAAGGTVSCLLVLTPDERQQGLLRLFVRHELILTSITLSGA